MANGDISAIRIASATAHNGWVAEIDISGLSTGGTYALGLGTNNDPSTAKIVFTVTSSGYDATGVLGTIQRTVYGTHEVRKPYPNQAVNDESGTVTVRVALSDFVFTGDTLAATIASGFYTQGGTPTNSVSGLSVTNNSTVAHPKVIANWSWPGWSKVSGPSFDVRCVAFHRSAMNGKPVACVIFTATDQHSHSVSVTVATPTIDPLMSDYGKVIEYIGTIPTTTFTPNDQITVNFKAYPWVGGSGATLDTSDGVNTQPTPKYAPQFYIYDAGTYGTSAAVVDSVSGSDSTGVAIDEKLFNYGSAPPAFATINKAAAAINSRNNSVYGRNDAAGTMYLKAGNYNWCGAANSISATAAKVWLTVARFPGVPIGSVAVNGQTGNQDFGGTPVKLQGIPINVSTAPVSIFTGITYLWLDQCSLVANGTAPIYQTQVYYITRGSVGVLSGGLKPFGGETSSPALIRGNDLTGLISVAIFTVLGNTNTAIGAQVYNNEPSGGPVSSTHPIFAFNSLYRQDTSGGNLTLAIHNATAGAIGAAIIQNIFERNDNSSVQQVIGIASDGSTIDPASNILLWHNTLVGGRINRGYNDTGVTSLLRNLWSEVGELRDVQAIKTDTFATESANRTGNWSVLYGVGSRGKYVVEASAGTPGFGATGAFQDEFDGINSYAPAKNGGTNPITSATNVVDIANFQSRKAFDGTNANAGMGDYNIGPSSPVRSLIRSGGSVLPFDLFGKARANDGTGAAGVSEFTAGAASVAEFDECLELAGWFDPELVSAALRWFDEDIKAGPAAPTAGNASLAEFDAELELLGWFDPELVTGALRWFDDDIKANTGPTYTLSLAQGSYTLTGQATAFTHGRTCVMVQGSYTLTGQSVGMTHGRTLSLSQGSYTLTGQATAFTHGRTCVMVQGSYTLTGQAVALTHGRTLSLSQGSYSLTGQSLAISAQRSLTVGQGSYALSGQAVTAIHGRTCTLAQGSYALTGQALALTHGRTITITQGSYALTGQALTLQAARKLALAQGSYSLTGQTVTLTYSGAPTNTYTLTIGQAAFSLSGQAMIPSAGRKLVLPQGSYTLTGEAMAMQAARKLALGQGSFTLSGQTANLRAARSLVLAEAGYTLTGNGALITAARKLAPGQGSYLLSGQAVLFNYSAAVTLPDLSDTTIVAKSLPYSVTVQGLPYSTEPANLPFTTEKT